MSKILLPLFVLGTCVLAKHGWWQLQPPSTSTATDYHGRLRLEFGLPLCKQFPRCTCNSNGAVLGIVECRSTVLTELDQFFRHTKMYSLYLDNNGLMEIGENSFQHSRLWSLSIVRNGLRELNKLALHGLERFLRHLCLKENLLTRVPHAAIRRLTFLTRLDLSDNHISSLSRSDFEGLENSLKELYFNNNNLLALKKGLFDGMKELKAVYFSGNRISLIDDRTFDGAHSLYSVNLQNNLLDRFPSSIVVSDPIKTVLLSGNLINNTRLGSDSERTFLSLNELDLSDNHINSTSLSGTSLEYKIGTLYLNGNRMMNLTESTFVNWKIEQLIMKECSITNMANKTFSVLASTLKSLDLSSNNIKSVPWAFLEECSKLEYLILKNNPLLKIDMKDLYHLSGLKYLDILHSPFTIGNISSGIKSLDLTSISLSLSNPSKMKAIRNFGKNVHYISLAHSSLTEIDEQIFSHCSSLKGIDLSFNLIKTFSDESTVMLSKTLEYLRVHDGFKGRAFPSEAISKLVNLKRLDFSSNVFDTIELYTFNSMKQIQYINLRSNKLTKLQTGLLSSTNNPNLKVIDMSFNQIQSVERNSFKSMRNIKVINLSVNKIAEIASEAFIDLPSVTLIDLSNNQIQILPDNAFSDIPFLERIDLSFNKISGLNMDSFHQLGALETLHITFHHNQLKDLNTDKLWQSYFAFESFDVSHNQIISIGDTFFDGIRETLLAIKLSHNKIANLSRAVFKNMAYIQYIDLSFNNISTIDVDLFRDCHNLELLNLSYNKISQMQSDFLQDHIKLKVLDLTGNLLSSLPPNFARLTSLSHLHLAANHFVEIPRDILGMLGGTLLMFDLRLNEIQQLKEGDLYYLKRIKYLDLSSNKLTYIEENAFRSPGDLQLLDLSHNNITEESLSASAMHLTKLRHLRLSNMSLTQLPLLHSRQLQYLDVSHNELTGFPIEFFINLTRLVHLDISNNEIFRIESSITQSLSNILYLNLASNPMRNMSGEFFGRFKLLETLDISGIDPDIIKGDALENMSSLKHLHMSLDEESEAKKSVTGLVSSIRSLSSLVLFLNTSLSQQLHVPLPDKLCRFIFLSPAESTARAGGLTITADALQNISCRSVHFEIDDVDRLRIEAGFFSALPAQHISLNLIGTKLANEQAPSVNHLDKLLLLSDNIDCQCGDIGWLKKWLQSWMLHNCPVGVQAPEHCYRLVHHLHRTTCSDGSSLAFTLNTLQCNSVSSRIQTSLVTILASIWFLRSSTSVITM